MSPDWPSIPRLPQLVLERPQLDRRLDSWAPVTVVRGPQGYGKTVLVASWLDRRRGPDVVPVWVAATPAMADPARFWAELHRQLDGAGLVQGDPAANPSGTELSVDVPAGRRVVVVVDNFQHICRPAVLDQLLALVETHRRLHLVVCYRAWHPIQSLAQASVGVEVVRPGDLLLSTGEIAALAAARGEPLPPGAAERVRDAVGGWLAAVRLVLDASGGDDHDLSVAEEYLRATVLPAIDSASGLEHLMRFSLARRLDQDLVRELCDDPDPDRYLQRLESSGLFERHPNGARVDLVLPAVVAEILRESYSGRHPERVRAFHRRLSAWYAARRDPDDALLALLHAVDGEDWDQAKRMWILHGPTLRMRAPEPFRQALDAMPDQVLSSHPAMLIDRMVANVVDDDSDLDGRMATIGAYFRSSTKLINRRLDALPAADLVYLGTGHLVGLRMLGRFEDSARFAEGLDRRTAAFPELTRAPSDGLGWFHLQWGLTRTLLGDGRSADAYRRSWEYGNRVPSNWIPANAAANLALTYAVEGDAGQAERWLDRYRWFETSEQWAHYLVGIGAHLADGLLALDRLDEGRLGPVLAHLGDGTSPVELWPFVAFLRAEHAIHYGDPASALADLDAAVEAHPPALSSGGVAAALLARARADLLMACGHGDRAALLLDAVTEPWPMAEVPLARLRLLNGEDAAARSIAARAFANGRVSRRDRLELLLVQALAAHQMGDVDAARRLFGHALETYRLTGVLRALTAVPAEIRDELLETAGHPLDAADRARLDRRVPIYPDRFVHLELTKRERAVLAALERTASRQEMADELYVSLNTVKTQLSALYKKLETTTRAQALIKAHQFGLLP